jgi:hypothetical protein
MPYDPAVVMQLLEEALQGGASVDGEIVFSEIAERLQKF